MCMGVIESFLILRQSDRHTDRWNRSKVEGRQVDTQTKRQTGGQ